MLRFATFILPFLFMVPSAHAISLIACGKILKAEGDSCSQLKVRFDLSACGESADAAAIVTCETNEPVATYKSKNATFRAVFEKKDAGWNKISYVLKGSLWKHPKVASKAKLPAAPTAQVIPAAQPVPVAEEPSRSVAALIAPIPTPVTAPSAGKPSDAELVKIVDLLSGFSFKGSIDGYYAYNLNSPQPVTNTPTTTNTQAQNKYHVFDTYHDDLQLSYAHFQVQKVTGPVTTTIDLAYGSSVLSLSGTKTDTSQINFKQAIIGYKPYEKLNIEAGRFVTHMGYEVIESQDNWNYSRSLLFGYFVPLWHQGAKATYTVTDQISVMAMVADGWNNSYPNSRQKLSGGQLAWTPSENLAVYLNTVVGSDFLPANVESAAPLATRGVYEFVGTYKVNPRLNFAINADAYQHGSYRANGVAVYARYQISDAWAIAPRLEYVEDRENLLLGESFTGGQVLSSYTLTVEDKLTPKLLMRVEARIDKSNQLAFPKDGTLKDMQSVGIFSVVASF